MKKTFLFCLLLVFSCKEEIITVQKPNPTDTAYIIIAGTVTELDRDGEYPSAKTNVHLSGHYYTKTDSFGRFFFNLNKDEGLYVDDNFFSLKVFKSNVDSINRSYWNLSDSAKANMSFELKRPVVFFPLKVGNKWEYEVYSNTGDSYNFKTLGKEIWEIKAIDESDYKTISLGVSFSGIKITSANSGRPDTSYINNSNYMYSLRLDDGYFLPLNGNKLPFGFKEIGSFQHHYVRSETYQYTHKNLPFDKKVYTLSLTQGIKKFEYYYFDGSWVIDKKLTLLNFNEGG